MSKYYVSCVEFYVTTIENMYACTN